MRTGPGINEDEWFTAALPLRTAPRTGSIRLAVLVLGIDADTDTGIATVDVGSVVAVDVDAVRSVMPRSARTCSAAFWIAGVSRPVPLAAAALRGTAALEAERDGRGNETEWK